MKKYLFFALAIAGMLSSCSSDDIVGGGDDSTNESLPVPIKIGFGNIASTTRGTGTVGDTASANNVWKGQKVKIYMLNKDFTGNTDSLRLAADQKGIIYKDSVFITPIGSDNDVAQFENNHIKYYPATGNFDFYGYRLDDAVQSFASDFNANGAVKDSLSIDFTIDGTQDIMVAKAVPDDSFDATTKARAYSAYSARHGLQPVLDFQHLLSRLTFNVIPGDSSVTKAGASVQITGITVKSVNKGTLVVAKKMDVAAAGNNKIQYIEWGTGGAGVVLPTDSATLTLMQRDITSTTTEADPLIPLVTVSLEGKDSIGTIAPNVGKWYAETVPVGEAIMLQPDVESYDIEIHMSQTVATSLTGGADPKSWETVYPATILPPTGSKFEAGKSYYVNIKVWGLEQIQVTTKLTNWKDGGEISINGEDLGF